ncbi:hypothetical protein RvY_10037 [Ramazzottius varieornatus]|uniref:HTH psq-type domain-containing protein n=1 Tax=Ramazzottius varieornatus TaxID=947166 RepID=A0A1D1VBF3_RAMVA|nr:hypothetical protein RvY_10037 [Ramazzottius varieornatus]
MDQRASMPFAEAIEDISAGMSTRAAALKYGIPRTTLLNHKNNPTVRKNGRPPALSENDEKIIADMFILCSEFKIELDQLKFDEVLADAARDQGLAYTDFGRGWYRLFLKRHPVVEERVRLAKVLKKFNKASNAKKLKEWTEESAELYVSMLQGLKTDGFLEDPRGIFSLGETTFEVEVGSRRLARLAPNGPSQEQIKVVTCGLADGTYFRPMLLMNNNATSGGCLNGVTDEIAIANNSSGVMEPSDLQTYVEEEIVPNLQCVKNVLFLSGRTSNVYTMELMQVCLKYGIRVVCFPGSMTEAVQPMGLHLTQQFQSLYRDYSRTLAWNPNEELTRVTFPRHITIVWRQISAQTNLIASFMETGIYPFDPQIIRGFVPHALPFPSEMQVIQATQPASPTVDPVAHAVSLVKIEDILTSEMNISPEEAHFLVDGLLQIMNRRSTVKRLATNFAKKTFPSPKKARLKSLAKVPMSKRASEGSASKKVVQKISIPGYFETIVDETF